MKRWFITALTALSLMVAVKPTWAQLQETVFDLTPQQKVLPCFAQPGYTPSATVIVQRGTDNDVLILRAQHIKPGLAFDLFTTQNTNLLADGQLNPAFTNFGLAWYQTDLEADSNGNVEATIKTILLDQIFGFDPAASLVAYEYLPRRLLVQQSERCGRLWVQSEASHAIQWPAPGGTQRHDLSAQFCDKSGTTVHGSH